MANLWINNVAFPVARDSFRKTPEFVGEIIARSPNGNLLESTTSKNKRRFRFTSAPMSMELARCWEHVIHGNGQSWSFTNGSLYSKKGATVATAGTYSTSTTSPVDALSAARRLEVSSGSAFQVDLADKMYSIEADVWLPSMGFAAALWRLNPNAVADEFVSNYDSWHKIGLTGTGTWTVGTPDPSNVAQYVKSGPATGDVVLASWAFGNFLSMSAGGRFAMHAKKGIDGASSTGAVYFDELLLWPFEIPSAKRVEWLTAWLDLADNVSAPPLPRVYVSGDALGTTQYNVVEVIGRVVEVRQMGAALAGSSFASNVCVMDVELIEV
jgi:hypothetical protein